MLKLLSSISKLILIFLMLTSPIFGQKTKRKNLNELDNLIHNSTVFNQHFTGFMLVDANTEEVLFKKDAEKYYTPASNTKLITFYTALKVLGDSLPIWRVAEKENQWIVQGTGNPMWKHPAFLSVDQPEPWKNNNFPLQISFDNWKSTRFGAGWSWADFPYYYQVERSPIPIRGNLIQFERDSSGKWSTKPGFWLNNLTLNVNEAGKYPKIYRSETENQFFANQAAITHKFKIEVPLKTDPNSILKILSEENQLPVSQYKMENDSSLIFSTIHIPVPDTLYRYFLQESDNFIGEQLLILCSNKQFGTLDPERFIRFAIDSLLKDLPQKPIWVDGSGLSRYNLFSPNDMVFILKKLFKMMPQERLLSFFPTGGVSGTLTNDYKSEGKPFVFAKTGSLSNNHCLSGYLVTNKGKVLIFSFMHNHFVDGNAVVKNEMKKVLTFLKNTY